MPRLAPHDIGYKPADLRRRKLERWTALEVDRSGWFTHWQEISDNLLPRSGRFFTTDRNRAGRDHYNRIYDSTPTKALRTIGSGLMAGASSPARPWFKLQTEDPDLNKFHPVRVWLEDVTNRMMRVFAKSNTYRTLHTMYEELAAFGTSVAVVTADFDRIIHHFPIPPGSFALQQSNKGRVNTVYRKFEWSVGEVVQEFGEENVSHYVAEEHRRRRLDSPVEIMHCIEPRDERDPRKQDNLNMPWRSLYMETGGQNNEVDRELGFLRESGFEMFPVLAPRWAVNGGDIYGHSPGMEALGDILQLGQEQLRKGQAIDYQTRPPIQAPHSLKNRDREMYPGGVSYYDQNTAGGGIRTAWEVNLDLNALLLDIEDVRRRIQGQFFADLFLMLASQPPGGQPITAAEVAERHEEKLLQLGPVLERLHNELLEPLIDITFDRMFEAGMIPPPPPDLAQGGELSIEFVSILAQAQRAIGVSSIDRWTQGIMNVSQFVPAVLDKFNSDQWVNVLSERLGVDATVMHSDEDAKATRDARAKAEAAQAQVEAMQGVAGAAKDLAAAPTTGDTALSDVLNSVSAPAEAP